MSVLTNTLITTDSGFFMFWKSRNSGVGSEIYVFGVGEKKTPLTPVSFRSACDDFLFTENLEYPEEVVPDEPAKTEKETPKKKSEKLPEEVALLKRAWEQTQDDQGWASFSAAGSFLKRTRPDFDPRTYGAKKFSDLLVARSEYFTVKKGADGQGYRAYKPVNEK